MAIKTGIMVTLLQTECHEIGCFYARYGYDQICYVQPWAIYDMSSKVIMLI